MAFPAQGRNRVIIEAVTPQIDGGRYLAKRIVGDIVAVEADIFADGHDLLSAVVNYRHESEREAKEAPLSLINNDRWTGNFKVERLGIYLFSIEAWVDHFQTWRRDLEKKSKANLDVSVELLAGAEIARAAVERSSAQDRESLQGWLATWAGEKSGTQAERIARALDQAQAQILHRYSDRSLATRSAELRIFVDPRLARYGAWYELFPRSTGTDGTQHGTFKSLEAQLPRIAKMGFQVLYLPPIHPIGKAFRKGRNNHPQAGPDDPGSPWAIGSNLGGHKAIHPELGNLEDFRHLVAAARGLGLSIALDIAFQCSPDHPYVREHPEWFKRRPDGSIQYAENPPKKYQDIYPFDFESPAADSLWQELKSVIDFWIQEGVTVFRVDNPHTKAFPFWEWLIGETKRSHPETIFLSEAFTRPKVMYGLAKIGFTQSYNYVPWRNTAEELRQFMTELIRPPVNEFYRPNLWPNTPDILPQYLQFGGRPAFMIRLLLAATLGASYGLYGPAYELSDHQPRAAGEEEYLHSEKYELKTWKLDSPDSLESLITRINAIRQEHPALQSNDSLFFHQIENEQMLVYSKQTEDRSDQILVAVNLDPHHLQRGVTQLSLEQLGIKNSDTYLVHDLLSDTHAVWRGARNLVEFDSAQAPGAIYHLRRRVRSEHDFDYFQ